jgi:hypothetical protein
VLYSRVDTTGDDMEVFLFCPIRPARHGLAICDSPERLIVAVELWSGTRGEEGGLRVKARPRPRVSCFSLMRGD